MSRSEESNVICRSRLLGKAGERKEQLVHVLSVEAYVAPKIKHSLGHVDSFISCGNVSAKQTRSTKSMSKQGKLMACQLGFVLVRYTTSVYIGQGRANPPAQPSHIRMPISSPFSFAIPAGRVTEWGNPECLFFDQLLSSHFHRTVHSISPMQTRPCPSQTPPNP